MCGRGALTGEVMRPIIFPRITNLEPWSVAETLERVLNLRSATSQQRAAVPRRARIEGAYTSASLNCRLESNTDEEEEEPERGELLKFH